MMRTRELTVAAGVVLGVWAGMELSYCQGRGSEEEAVLKVSGITTVYRRNSHAEMFLSRLVETDSLDGKGATLAQRLVAVFTDQVPEDDVSRELANRHGFRIGKDVANVLTDGDGKLAVDGVYLIAEHGDYEESETGQIVFPKRRLFGEIVRVFESTGEVVPVFSDKHLADNWEDAKWIYDQAEEMGIPLMAGSSLPVLWRDPAIDVKRGAKVDEIVALSYGRLDSYGFHAVEMVQALAERRAGGGTGVAGVRCLTGEAVWEAGREGIYDRALLDAALGQMKLRKIPEGKRVEDLLRREPAVFLIEYEDGLKASVFTLNGAVAEWVAAWREDQGEEIRATIFSPQEGRPYFHFTHLMKGIDGMMRTGAATWPVERTLLTSGILDAALRSKTEGGRRIATPWMEGVEYQTEWEWKQPPPPPPVQPRVRKKKQAKR